MPKIEFLEEENSKNKKKKTSEVKMDKDEKEEKNGEIGEKSNFIKSNNDEKGSDIASKTDSTSKENGKQEDSRIGACMIVKKEGNEHYNNKRYKEAMESYEKCLRFSGMMFKKPDSEISRPIKRDIHLNMALCSIKQRNFSECKEHCNNVLEELNYPNNVKALFRRGTAFKEMNMFDKAREDFQMVIDLDKSPDKTNIKQATKQLTIMKKLERQSEKKHKKIFGGMFEQGKMEDIYKEKHGLINTKNNKRENKVITYIKKNSSKVAIGIAATTTVIGIGFIFLKKYQLI